MARTAAMESPEIVSRPQGDLGKPTHEGASFQAIGFGALASVICNGQKRGEPNLRRVFFDVSGIMELIDCLNDFQTRSIKNCHPQ